MPKQKVTMLFNAVTTDSDGNAYRQAGWSESWYFDGEFDGTLINARRDNLLARRVALLPANCKIVAVRMQQIDPVGPSKLIEITYPGVSTANNDLPSVSLLWNVRSTNGRNHRSVILRGIPDARIVKGEYSPTDTYNNAIRAYFTELSSGWQMKGVDKTKPAIAINAIGVEGTYDIRGINPWAANARVKLLRVRNTNGHSVRGEFTIGTAVPGARVGTIGPWPTTNGVVSNSGKMREVGVEYSNVTLTDYEVLDPLAITRKAGRPFFAFHGRRAAKR